MVPSAGDESIYTALWLARGIYRLLLYRSAYVDANKAAQSACNRRSDSLFSNYVFLCGPSDDYHRRGPADEACILTSQQPVIIPLHTHITQSPPPF